jgi:hypothetical protein
MTLASDPQAEIVYCRVVEEHADNERYLKDCERWFGKPVTIIGAEKYDCSIFSVFAKTKYIAGIHGAACTRTLKREVREAFSRPTDINVFGYTIEEVGRLNSFIDANPNVRIHTPLIDHSLTKADCKAIIERAGIELPAMYRLGYRNNNCIGCVKGGNGYQAKIRQDFPDEFNRLAAASRKMGVRLLKLRGGGKTRRIFLDELPADTKPLDDSEDVQCGVFCHLAEAVLREGAP